MVCHTHIGRAPADIWSNKPRDNSGRCQWRYNIASASDDQSASGRLATIYFFQLDSGNNNNNNNNNNIYLYHKGIKSNRVILKLINKVLTVSSAT